MGDPEGATRLWHGFADMHTVASDELVIVRGEGCWVEDAGGRRYLDATGGLWYAAVGYGRQAIADAVSTQMTKLHAYSNFGSYATEPTLQLADRLAAIAPIPDGVVFFTSGGSESVETAAKLVRRYWDAVGRPEKQIIVAREHSYHGMAAYGTSLAGIPGNRDGYGPLVQGTEFIPHDDPDALARLLEDHGDRVAAFIAEPVIGAGGVYPPSPGYWAAIQDLCRRHDVLLVADEVVTGFGRMGRWFASERYNINPDILIFAKAVTSGYMPLGGLIVGERVKGPFWGSSTTAVFRHGYTYSGHAAACAGALANLDIIENEKLLGRVRDLEPVLASALDGLTSAPLVSEVRCVGLTAAIELDASPSVVERVVVAARNRGVLTRSLRGKALHVSPPFVITEGEIALLASTYAEALADVAAISIGNQL